MTKVCRRCVTPAGENARFCRNCGARLLPRFSLALPRSRNARRLIGVAVVALVLAIGGAVWVSQTVVYPPEEPVKTWFEALASRDTATARHLAGSLPILDKDSLKTGYVPPSNLEIAGVDFGGALDDTRRPNKNVAYVKVRYRVGGQPVEGSIQVWRDRGGPVRPWSLGDGATGPLIVINALVSRTRVAGAEVATAKAKPAKGFEGAVWVPPGVFTISGSGDDPLFTGKPATVAVRAGAVNPSEPAVVELELETKAEAVTTIEAQIRKRLDECAKLTELALNSCPFGYRSLDGIGATNVRWRIDSYPRITLTPSANHYVSQGQADVHTAQPGRAAAIYERLGAADSRSVDIVVRGAVRIMPDGSLCWNEQSSALSC